MHLTREVILPETLDLLHALAADDVTVGHRLVGGTSLALQIGHRLSVDLDFFTPNEFDSAALAEDLGNRYGFLPLVVAKNTLIGAIDDIKVDFIRHPYIWIEEPLYYEKARLAGMLEISAMKLNAIVNSGQRIKDFWDVYFLLGHFSLLQMVKAYEKKYPFANGMVALKALGYFDDIDPAREPAMLVKKQSFTIVQERIVGALQNMDKVF